MLSTDNCESYSFVTNSNIKLIKLKYKHNIVLYIVCLYMLNKKSNKFVSINFKFRLEICIHKYSFAVL